MNNSTNHSASGGIGFFGLLAIVFIVLKLCNVIDWSWVWVLAPLWAPIALIGTVIATLVVFVLLGRGIMAIVRKAKGY